MLTDPLPTPSPDALCPQKDSPIYLTARTLRWDPRTGRSTAISQDLCVMVANSFLSSGASPGLRVADVHLLQVGKLGLRGSKKDLVASRIWLCPPHLAAPWSSELGVFRENTEPQLQRKQVTANERKLLGVLDPHLSGASDHLLATRSWTLSPTSWAQFPHPWSESEPSSRLTGQLNTNAWPALRAPSRTSCALQKGTSLTFPIAYIFIMLRNWAAE